MSGMEKYQRYAKRIKLFNGLKPDEVSDILHRGTKMEFREGQTIFHRGQGGKTIFMVFRGTVDISLGKQVIAKCRVGDAFGEMSVLNHKPHCATAAAHTDVKVFTISEDDSNEILNRRVAIRFLLNIIHVLSGHLETANTAVAEMQRGESGA